MSSSAGHYAEWKHSDPALVQDMIDAFPFATITACGEDAPVVAQAPITFRAGANPAGAIEFHLALANRITSHLPEGKRLTVVVHGPGAQVSPRWFTASFTGDRPDRSQTAPTYNYVSLVVSGTVKHLDDAALQTQIADLVATNEGKEGWQLNELAANLWSDWRQLIRLYRMEIESFDLTAKLTPGDVPEDRPGVVAGLRSRRIQDDEAMARLLEHYDGTPEALREGLRALRKPLVPSPPANQFGGVRGH